MLFSFLLELVLYVLATRWQSRGATSNPNIVESLKINIFIALLRKSFWLVFVNIFIALLRKVLLDNIFKYFASRALVNIWSITVTLLGF